MDLEGMDLTRFHKVREGVKSNAAPGSAGERAAAEALVRSALEATPGFLHVEVERTDDPDRLVIAMCSYSPDLSTSDTAAALLGLWLHQVSYPFWRRMVWSWTSTRSSSRQPLGAAAPGAT
jgi:hypothetical protein